MPRSHHVWRTRRTKEAGERNDTSPIPSAPFCWSVAASANRNAAQRARTPATRESLNGRPYAQTAAQGRAAARAAIARWPASVTVPPISIIATLTARTPSAESALPPSPIPTATPR